MGTQTVIEREKAIIHPEEWIGGSTEIGRPIDYTEFVIDDEGFGV